MNMKEGIERMVEMVPPILTGICAVVLVGSSFVLLMSCMLADQWALDLTDHQRITMVASATLFGLAGLGCVGALVLADGMKREHQ
jgi:hypothetical protein